MKRDLDAIIRYCRGSDGVHSIKTWNSAGNVKGRIRGEHIPSDLYALFNHGEATIEDIDISHRATFELELIKDDPEIINHFNNSTHDTNSFVQMNDRTNLSVTMEDATLQDVRHLNNSLVSIVSIASRREVSLEFVMADKYD